MEVLLAIVGSILAIIGSINAFFIKGLMNSINNVRMDLIRTSTEHESTIRDVKDNKVHIKELEVRIHKIEGGQSQLLSYIKDSKI